MKHSQYLVWPKNKRSSLLLLHSTVCMYSCMIYIPHFHVCHQPNDQKRLNLPKSGNLFDSAKKSNDAISRFHKRNCIEVMSVMVHKIPTYSNVNLTCNYAIENRQWHVNLSYNTVSFTAVCCRGKSKSDTTLCCTMCKTAQSKTSMTSSGICYCRQQIISLYMNFPRLWPCFILRLHVNTRLNLGPRHQSYECIDHALSTMIIFIMLCAIIGFVHHTTVN